MWMVYILYSRKLDKYYVGRTQNLPLRLQYHNSPIENRKFTARGIPWELQLGIPCQSKEQSIRLEKIIKQTKSRIFLESLLTQEAKVTELLKKTGT